MMSLVFSLEIRPSRMLARCARVPWGLAVLSGTAVIAQTGALNRWLKAWPDALFVLWCLGILWAASLVWRAQPMLTNSVRSMPRWMSGRTQHRYGVGTRLSLDQHGTLYCQPPSATTCAVRVVRVLRLPHLIVLWLSPSLSERRRPPCCQVIVARDAVDHEAWRNLCSWLLWLQRGPQDAGLNP